MLPERIGTYRIVEPIGRGGMGVVYRAWDEHLGLKLRMTELGLGKSDGSVD